MRPTRVHAPLSILLSLLLAGPFGCGRNRSGAAATPAPGTPAAAGSELSAAEAEIRAADLERWVQDLSSDQMEGRLPGTPGEEKATAWIAKNFQSIGLKPANGGSWFQDVPLVGITSDPSMTLKVNGRGRSRVFKYADDFMAGTSREQEKIDASGELVFVGYGVVAPEFGWDDYKGQDVRGKVLVMLVNDPPLPDPRRFGGKAMTYYGRWTYKFEIGAEKGAAGVILVHETKPAGYPWAVVVNSWSGEQFVAQRPNHGADRMPFESWMTHQAASDLFRMAGMNLAEMERKAARDEFAPVDLGLRASIALRNTLREVTSKNVAGLLPGTDLAGEWVLYTAHWDHLGVSTPVDGDAIYNGAFDNATGVASLLGIARALASLPTPPRRSILFLAVTAEEQGLLGSAHYADDPLHPLARTAALINMDGMNVLGRTRDVIVVGLGNTTLDDLVVEVAKAQGRHVVADQEPEKGFYYRSDQLPFARKGVPALYVDHGLEYVGRPDGWGLEQNDKYTSEHYHKPSDEFDPDWDFSGMEEDARLLLRVGWMTAQADAMPAWKDGTEFKAIRDRSLARAAQP